MVTFDSVSFAYRSSPALFNDLTFDIPPGRIVGLLGRNGAGKTSLLKLATGLLFARSGGVSLFGRPADRRSPESLRRVAYVPEQFSVSPVTAREWVRLEAGFHDSFPLAAVDELLERFEVPLATRMDRLSYGQQKKALIAAAIGGPADLVVLDEPTNGLDIPSKQLFRQLVASAAGEERTIVISTHQVRDVEHLIDTVTILEGGSIVLDAGIDRVANALTAVLLPDEDAARAAGAFAWDRRVGGVVAIVPRGQSTADDVHDADDGEIDLELLFQAAVAEPERIAQTIGGAA